MVTNRLEVTSAAAVVTKLRKLQPLLYSRSLYDWHVMIVAAVNVSRDDARDASGVNYATDGLVSSLIARM